MWWPWTKSPNPEPVGWRRMKEETEGMAQHFHPMSVFRGRSVTPSSNRNNIEYFTGPHLQKRRIYIHERNGRQSTIDMFHFNPRFNETWGLLLDRTWTTAKATKAKTRWKVRNEKSQNHSMIFVRVDLSPWASKTICGAAVLYHSNHHGGITVKLASSHVLG